MKKILVVDDSLLDRKLIMRTITKSGVENEILQAENGEEGVNTLKANAADVALVLLDYQMPVMSGIDFLEATQKDSELADIPVVMITASSAQENKDIAYNANPKLAGYVVKPYKADDVLELVKPHLV